MVKPKFTPDPPPNIDGLPVEDQVRMLLDHMQRTHNRIEDWWPKDFENRIQALEGLVPYKIGPWVMVSLSSMDWVHDVVTGSTCGTAVATKADNGGTEAEAMNNMYNIDYSADENTIVVSGSMTTFTKDGVGLRAFRMDTGARGSGVIGCTRSGHKIVSTPGTSDNGLIAIVNYVNCGTSTRELRFYELTGNGLFTTYSSGANFSSNNVKIEAERDADILLSTDINLGREMRLVSKLTTPVITNASCPSGWWSQDSGAAAAVSDTVFLVCLQNEADNTLFSFYTLTGSTFSGSGVAMEDLGATIQTVSSRPVKVGSSIYWYVVLNSAAPYLTYFVETDLSGNFVRKISAYDTNAWVNTSSSLDPLSYSSEDNSLYYMYNDVVWRYYLTENTYHQCEPAYDSTYLYDEARERSVVHYGGNAWTVVRSVDTADGWIIEKSPVSFA